MKTGYFAVVTVLLAPMILMDIFQVKAEILDMADNAFDDEYLKCTDRMEINEAVKMAGQSRKDYIYGFQFKAFHFYLTKALQLLRRSCEDSYKNVVYSINQNTSFTFGGLNQARFGHFTLAYSAKPQAANDQNEAGNNLILQSTNKTCSHYECAFLGGMKNQESTDLPGMKGQEATQIPAACQSFYKDLAGEESRKSAVPP
ncbi:ecto-ADP-ribosyltransferase 3 precursor [Camelus ferus]|nr:ecto-ADP-ribosyltransferase 3 precursor [Camelus ferus]